MSPRVLAPLFLLACLAGCPGQQASPPMAPTGPAVTEPAPALDAAPAAVPEVAADGKVTVDALITDGPVMQHPVVSGPVLPGQPRRVESYLEIDGVQTVVYASEKIDCVDGAKVPPPQPGVATAVRRRDKPAKVRLHGRWTEITAEKFGQEGTERQFSVSSWECLP